MAKIARPELASLVLLLALAATWPLAWMGVGLPYSRLTFVALPLPFALTARRIGRGTSAGGQGLPGGGAGRVALARVAPAPLPTRSSRNHR